MKKINEYILESLQYNDDDFVDLGLQSKILWGKYNLGADENNLIGEYFAWGETHGYNENDNHEFSSDNYKFYDKYDSSLKSNIYKKYSYNDKKTILDDNDNAVKKILGREYDIPSRTDFWELIQNTNTEYINYNGINGLKFISNNDSSKFIFIPFSGVITKSNIFGYNKLANLSGKETNAGFNYSENTVLMISKNNQEVFWNDRKIGYNIRPIKRK